MWSALGGSTIASLLNLVSLDEAVTVKEKHWLHAPIEPISDARGVGEQVIIFTPIIVN